MDINAKDILEDASINLNMPILTFSCVGPSGIGGFSSILKDHAVEKLRDIVKPRVVCTSEVGYPYYRCVILQTTYEVLTSAPEWVSIIYKDMVSKYGQEKMDVFVPKDSEVVIDVMKTMIDYIFDREGQERIMVQYTDSSLYMDNHLYSHSMEELIDLTLRRHFFIEMRYGSGNLQTAIISKKETTNE